MYIEHRNHGGKWSRSVNLSGLSALSIESVIGI